MRRHEQLFEEAETNWRPCRNVINAITELAARKDPSWWYDELSRLSDAVDDSFEQPDLVRLSERLSAFGDIVDRWLYRADKKLRKAIQ